MEGMNPEKRAVVLLSGGSASAVALAYAVRAKLQCLAIHLSDPAKLHAWSSIAALRVAAQHGVDFEDVPTADLTGPAANLVRLAHATAAAARFGASRIILGTMKSATANAEQPFFHELFATLATTAIPDDRRVVVFSPLAMLDRIDAIRWGATELGVDFSRTDDCEGVRPFAPRKSMTHCGACMGCLDRRAAFVGAEVEDPASYQVAEA